MPLDCKAGLGQVNRCQRACLCVCGEERVGGVMTDQ